MGQGWNAMGLNAMVECKCFPQAQLFGHLGGGLGTARKQSHWWFTEARGSVGFETSKES